MAAASNPSVDHSIAIDFRRSSRKVPCENQDIVPTSQSLIDFVSSYRSAAAQPRVLYIIVNEVDNSHLSSSQQKTIFVV